MCVGRACLNLPLSRQPGDVFTHLHSHRSSRRLCVSVCVCVCEYVRESANLLPQKASLFHEGTSAACQLFHMGILVCVCVWCVCVCVCVCVRVCELCLGRFQGSWN